MENRFIKECTVGTSQCDAQGFLGVCGVFDVFMDLAAEHAMRLGVGYRTMLERRCCWVAVRTRVRFLDRPALGTQYTAVTWPGKPGLAKCDRFYRLVREDEVLAEGRTEWAVQDIDTGMVRRTASFGYPMELPVRPERVCDEPFTRFRDDEPGAAEPVRLYTVGPMDIDVGRHMNNVAYIRMLLGTFSVAEQEAMTIREAEVSYRRACFEGEPLSICRRREDGAWRFEVRRPDGETAVHALFRTADG